MTFPYLLGVFLRFICVCVYGWFGFWLVLGFLNRKIYGNISKNFVDFGSAVLLLFAFRNCRVRPDCEELKIPPGQFLNAEVF